MTEFLYQLAVTSLTTTKKLIVDSLFCFGRSGEISRAIYLLLRHTFIKFIYVLSQYERKMKLLTDAADWHANILISGIVRFVHVSSSRRLTNEHMFN